MSGNLDECANERVEAVSSDSFSMQYKSSCTGSNGN
jgi:hypothetical protein